MIYRTFVCTTVCLFVCLSHLSVHYGRTVGWIKMSLGTEVGLVQGHTVLDGDSAPSAPKGAQHPPLFGPCLLWPNGRASRQLLSSCFCMILLSSVKSIRPRLYHLQAFVQKQKQDLIFWKLWSVFIGCNLQAPMLVCTGLSSAYEHWRLKVISLQLRLWVTAINRDSWDSYLKLNWSKRLFSLRQESCTTTAWVASNVYQ